VAGLARSILLSAARKTHARVSNPARSEGSWLNPSATKIIATPQFCMLLFPNFVRN